MKGIILLDNLHYPDTTPRSPVLLILEYLVRLQIRRSSTLDCRELEMGIQSSEGNHGVFTSRRSDYRRLDFLSLRVGPT